MGDTVTNLYNVNLETRECVVEVTVDVWNCDFEEAITRIREAATGLTDPRLGAESGAYDGDEGRIVVSGQRLLTDAEYHQRLEEKAEQQRFRDYMKRFPG
jgi:hypothetical protein